LTATCRTYWRKLVFCFLFKIMIFRVTVFWLVRLIDQELAECCHTVTGQTLHLHSPGGSTLRHEMTSWPPTWKYAVKSKIRLRQSMQIHIRSKFHPYPIWNEGALFFFEEVAPTRRKTRWQVAIWNQFSIWKLFQIRLFCPKLIRKNMQSQNFYPFLPASRHCPSKDDDVDNSKIIMILIMILIFSTIYHYEVLE